MPYLRYAALALLTVSSLAPGVRADFPQLKINFVDTSQAPKIRVWASVASKGFRPPGDKDLSSVTLLKKPDKGQAEALFSFEDGELVWPKGLSEEEQKVLEKKMAPEFALAAETDFGAAMVVIVPGFQDPEYRNGTLGERSRNGAALFFKKLGKNNLMNAIWYNDYVWSYVFAEGREGGLTRLEPELAKCAKWEREQLENWGLSEAELLEKLGPPQDTPRKGEALCGLHANYGDFGKYIQKSSYDGFWPQLFGLPQKMCIQPEHELKHTGIGREGGTPEKRLVAMDAALEMLA
ncbi:MAG: hypothetical protein KC492_41255, partial [Myxococcales bacterium]|nr:hypothetical protein [Myxococcales bacterium]